MTAIGAGSTARAEPPAELVARFKEALERLWPGGGRLGLAVSGGPDSMAMLLLAHAAVPGEFEVATVDHGLRPEAEDECALVVAACEARGISCEVLTVEVGEGNVQAKARLARYLALETWALRRGLPVIATAHHADDQAETLLMRLNRGSGLSGLAGVRERGQTPHCKAAVIRPLLSVRRAELQRVAEVAGLEVARDPSNEDERFDRVRIRRALAEADWLDPLALARSASLLGEAQGAIEAAADDEWANSVFEEDDGFRYYPTVGSVYLEIEVVTAIMARMGGAASRSEVARLIERLRRNQAGNLGGVHVRPTSEQLADAPGPIEKWVFRPEPPRRVH